MTIKAIYAREILDSRGNPTIEADLFLDDGTMGRASVPSGASTGAHEAHELRDGDSQRYGGKGVLKAIAHIQGEVSKALVGTKADQRKVDSALIELDGTENKERIGANAILAISLATAHAIARAKKQHLFEYIRTLSASPRDFLLPTPQCNVLNGGAHTNWESTDIQEFMVMPVGAKTFRDGIRALTEIFHALKATLKDKGYGTTVGDEGGFAPKLKGNEEALAFLAQATEAAGYKLGPDIVFALDCAASELFESDSYRLSKERKILSSSNMREWYGELQKKYPIRSIEDGLAEDDWDGWKDLTAALGSNTQLVGDDIFVTNVKFLERGIKEKTANSILIKVNQIGTLSETVDAVDMAHRAGWRAVISHRSGETEDTTIAHIAVGLGTGQIKTGSVSRSDRTAKYNELMRIEEILGGAQYAGSGALQ